ncbi:ankyrin repeat domain-containing 62 [Paramuricea clavata]|uniref:Ankyrin repeat domain-containing 62 n=1 Tax=Paramuricea clavata TaxID=317549 RepID=A0A7D9JTE8_PARCT|nr:ankyrin repeat domain-containing 62 [Paramuricea clavata]
MWNFTVRGLVVPNVDGIEDLFESKETAEEPQHSLKDVKVQDTFIDSDNPISDMSEKDFNDRLTKQDFSEKKKPNNATTNGTAAIIEEFGTEFGVPCEHAKEYLPFDDTNKVFNIEAARKHHVFLASLKEHKKEMAETIRILKNAEKELQFNVIEENDNDNVNDDLDNVHFTDINKQKVNAKFDNVFKNMMKRMWEAQQGDEEKFENFIGWLHSHRNAWENVKDFNGRTLIHAAVENDNLSMVKTLVCAGVNINAKERCGATALTIAVIKKNEEMCKFLLENFAICDDHFFPTIPSPHVIARKLELGVANLMDEKSKAEIATNIKLWETVQNTEEIEQQESVSENDQSDRNDEAYRYERKSSLTLFVGDQGTKKSREAFNVHPTTKHKEQDPFPDQLKAAHFVLERKFVTPDLSRSKVEQFGDPKKTPIPISNIDAYDAGKRKVIQNFEQKKFSLYGISIEQNDSDKSDNEEMDSN